MSSRNYNAYSERKPYDASNLVTIQVDPKKMLKKANKLKNFLIFQNGVENYTLINCLFIVLLYLSVLYNKCDTFNANTIMMCIIIYLTITICVSWYISYKSYKMNDIDDRVRTAEMAYNVICFMSCPFYILFFVSALTGIIHS